MKVVHVNMEDIKGGAAIACNRLSEALNQNGVSSETFNIEKLPYLLNKKVWFNLILEKFIFSFYQKSNDLRFKFSIPFFGINISKYKAIREADVIHLHWVYNGFLSINSLKKISKLNKPVVWTLHDQGAFTGGCFYSGSCENYKNECGDCFYLKNQSKHDISNKTHALKKAVYPSLNMHIVACSNWLATLAKSSKLMSGRNVRAIPNPIDIERFSPQNKANLKNKLSLSDDKYLILFVAANVADVRKGMSYLNEAIVTLCNNYSEIKESIELIIVGDVKNETFSFPCKSTPVGYIADEMLMRDYYAVSDMFVSPSLEDNLPNTIMESLSCGTPVLAYDIGGIPDLVDHKQNGYLASYKSVPDLINGFVWIFENRKEGFLNENSRNKVLNNFKYTVVAEKYKQLYKDVL